MPNEKVLKSQIIPLIVAVTSAVFFVGLLFVSISLTNFVFPQEKIHLSIKIFDLLLGFYLYVKTSIDFAVFIGNMLISNPRWKNRLIIEWGTSLGNFCGTILIIWIWSFFRTISPLLEGIVIVLASFVLLELAAGSLSRLRLASWNREKSWHKYYFQLVSFLLRIRHLTAPFLGWMPDVEQTMTGKKFLKPASLLLYSFSVPFILGSDDFASYISIFNVVNIFSFAIGVILGHLLLLGSFFLAPSSLAKLLAKPAFSALAIFTFLLIFFVGIQDGLSVLLAWGKNHLTAFTVILIVTICWSISKTVRETFAQKIQTGFLKVRQRALLLIQRRSLK